MNILGILRGPNHLSKLTKETILVIGAHYDTVETSTGTDDNGSGTVAVLEAARLLSMRRREFNHTVIFVAFDWEETVRRQLCGQNSSPLLGPRRKWRICERLFAQGTRRPFEAHLYRCYHDGHDSRVQQKS